jgi:hypothetical protein
MSYLNQRRIKQETIKWVNSSLTAREYAFVTLTLKQSILGEPLTAGSAQADAGMFLDMLNNRILGNAHRRFGKRLTTYDVTEGGDQSEKRRHRHMQIEIPATLSFSEFESLVRKIRMKSRWGDRRVDVQLARDVKHVTKYMTKTGIDAICLDTTSF